jgi:tRNA pseudouridine13 synthase
VADLPVTKHRAADFLVRENVVLDLVDRAEASHEYLLLRKLGFTTFEAIRLVAGELGIAQGDVTYAGLKDEDGITEQLIAVPATAAARPFQVRDAGRWLRLGHYGYGAEPLRVGRLNGNGFRVVVRNLDAAHCLRFAGQQRLNTFALNYYDTQRFGVPGGPKRTHEVGEAILRSDWDTALGVLRELGAPESEPARAWSGTALEFFRGLDPRVTAFYCAAHSSWQWNTELEAAVRHACPDACYQVELEGLRYLYVKSAADTALVLCSARDLPYTRYGFAGDRAQPISSLRATVVQAIITVLAAPEPDECFPGRQRVTLSFFLPSGCYATAVLRQLMGYVE